MTNMQSSRYSYHCSNLLLTDVIRNDLFKHTLY